MKLTRDSAALGIAAAVAALAYLAAVEKPPMEWSYREWIAAGSAGAMWLSGKLSNSWLKHSDDNKPWIG
jgi:hypothetical protein